MPAAERYEIDLFRYPGSALQFSTGHRVLICVQPFLSPSKRPFRGTDPVHRGDAGRAYAMPRAGPSGRRQIFWKQMKGINADKDTIAGATPDSPGSTFVMRSPGDCRGIRMHARRKWTIAGRHHARPRGNLSRGGATEIVHIGNECFHVRDGMSSEQAEEENSGLTQRRRRSLAYPRAARAAGLRSGQRNLSHEEEGRMHKGPRSSSQPFAGVPREGSLSRGPRSRPFVVLRAFFLSSSC